MRDLELVGHEVEVQVKKRLGVNELEARVAEARASGKRQFKLLRVQTQVSDMVAPIEAGAAFDKAQYYEHPQLYRPVFHERVAPYTSNLINGMYWDRRFPRLLTNQQLRNLKSEVPIGLIGCADISADKEGSLEFLTHMTQVDAPFYMYLSLIHI